MTAPTRRPLDVHAIASLRELANAIEAGMLAAVRMELDDSNRVKLTIEAVDADVSPVESEAPKRDPRACPNCSSFEVRADGHGEIVCLKCNANWPAPDAPPKKGS